MEPDDRDVQGVVDEGQDESEYRHHSSLRLEFYEKTANHGNRSHLCRERDENTVERKRHPEDLNQPNAPCLTLLLVDLVESHRILIVISARFGLVKVADSEASDN